MANAGRRIILAEPKRIEFQPVELGPLQPGQARLKSLYNGISHGTEMAHYRGTTSDVDVEFDPELRIFHPRRDDVSPFPMPMGYETVARVVEVAPDVTELSVGDLVHVDDRHADELVIDVDEARRSDLYPLVKLPASMKPTDALYISLGCVALQVIHDARIKVGDSVAVFGLGAVGLLVAQLARLNGASWVVGFDPLTDRRALAERCGVSVTLDPTQTSAGQWVKENAPAAEDGEVPPLALRRGVDVALETSGVYSALHEAFRSAAVGGRVVTPAGYWYQGGAALRLGEEFLMNRVDFISSFGVGGNPHRDYPRWNRLRMMRTVTNLLTDKSLDVSSFPSRFFPFDEAPAAYELVDTNPSAAVKVALQHDA